ncbi:MAG: L,D-transpeptidase family protein [Kiloniellales bacterium]
MKAAAQRLGPALGVLLCACWLPAVALAQLSGDIIGESTLYVADGEDTLLDVARDHDLGVLEVMAANPGVDPWVPGHGTPVLLPTAHILPDAPRRGIVINLAELRLYYFPPKGAPWSTAIGIGREAFTTPLGTTQVVRKQADPTWFPTASARAENPDLPAAVPPGPANPLGKYALYLGWNSYLIHGTNKPYGVGRRVSRGCIRLYPEAIARLFQEVKVGTTVTVVAESVKLGWHDGELYLEAHPEIEQLDILEETGAFPLLETVGLDERIIAAAGEAAGRLDWPVVQAALTQRRGTPVRITLLAGT